VASLSSDWSVIADFVVRTTICPDWQGSVKISWYGDGSIKNDFAVAFASGAVAFASKDAPIFKGKDSWHSCSRD
jgi:hypothetical protein